MTSAEKIIDPNLLSLSVLLLFLLTSTFSTCRAFDCLKCSETCSKLSSVLRLPGIQPVILNICNAHCTSRCGCGSSCQVECEQINLQCSKVVPTVLSFVCRVKNSLCKIISCPVKCAIESLGSLLTEGLQTNTTVSDKNGADLFETTKDTNRTSTTLSASSQPTSTLPTTTTEKCYYFLGFPCT